MKNAYSFIIQSWKITVCVCCKQRPHHLFLTWHSETLNCSCHNSQHAMTQCVQHLYEVKFNPKIVSNLYLQTLINL